ncbi:MAG: translocation/assembly module TamB domain-containing protein [Bacteroidota bacterium]
MIAYLVLLIVTFFILGFITLQIPAVQENLISRYLTTFSSVSGFQTTVESFNLVWYDRLEINELRIRDPEKNTMIHAKKLKVNFVFHSLLKKNNVNIDGVELDSTQVSLITIPESDTATNLNINIFINQLNKITSSGKGGGGSRVNIGEIVINNALFQYNQQKISDSVSSRFDYKHFSLSIPEVQAQNFKIIGDTTQFNVMSLQATDLGTILKVDQLQTFFRLSQTSMEFLGLHLKAGKSEVSDTIIFQYNSQLDLSDFVHKVNIKAHLTGTTVHPNDLALFAPEVSVLKHPIQLSGSLRGKINKLFYKQMNIQYANSHFNGNLEMDGLPIIRETFINLKLSKSKIDIHDFSFAIPKDAYSRLEPLKTFTLNGTFSGFITDFVAKGDFEGPLGKIVSDVNLKINEENVDRSSYEGNLHLIAFELGTYLKDTTMFQKVSLTGRIQGKGLTAVSADFSLAGSISSLGIRGYNYQNILTDANFSKQFFKGFMKIDDPNLQFNASGSIDFREGKNLVNLVGKIDTAFLKPLFHLEKNIFIQSNLDIDTKGLQLDSLLGDVFLSKTSIQYEDESLAIDSIHMVSTRDSAKRKITLQSSLMDLNLEGNYYYSTLFNDLHNLGKEFLLNLKNDKEATKKYYSEKKKSTQEYFATLQVTLHNINPIIDLTDIDLHIAVNTLIEGKFANGYTSIVDVYTKIDSIKYENIHTLDNSISFTGSKIRDSTNVLAMFTLNSEKQYVDGFSTEHLLAEAIWNNEHIDVGLDFDQKERDNLIRLKAEIDFLADSTKIKILPSRIRAIAKEWAINQQNYTLISGHEIKIHHLEVVHENESMMLDGRISNLPEEKLLFTLHNLNLDILNTFSKEFFSGTLNGHIEGRNLYVDPYLQNNISVSEFTINDFLIGDITGSTTWNQEKKLFDINLFIDRFNKRTVNIIGNYCPSREKDPLEVDAKFEAVNLKIIEPLLKDIFSEMDGTLTGSYHLTGNFVQPKITGEGRIEDGQILINYLKVKYFYNGILEMSPAQIIFKELELADAFKNKGRLDGYVAHQNFNKFRINLDGSFKNFQILNTTSKDNSLFYGQAYATGNLNIFGATSNLKFSATARTEKNTRIFIPINGSGNVGDKDYIRFIDFTDSVKNKAAIPVKKRQASGITMDLNIDITPDAYGEIIFDLKAGDIIRGRGKGDLHMLLDTKGDFNMFGSLEFTQGAYNFTLYDIINKEFSVKPGSRISWFGDPYQGLMNITASYRQLTSFAPILSDQSYATAPQIKRKYPAEVWLKLDGLMLSPQINFDIVAQNLPDNLIVEGKPTPVRLQFEFDAFKAKLDEQELKRQVFSLIVLKRFSPPDAFNTSGTLSNSVSELLSNQLSYWLTQVDQNLEINLDLGTLDEEAFNTFQLRLSYSFLNGRLRVTRDGSLEAGDWIVDYLLTPDGKFKAKMYSRSNYNQINNSLSTQTAITTGFSLLYTKNFNNLKDLWIKRRKEVEEQGSIPDEGSD